MRPHRQQAIRLPCPWDSPGNNTGVGCHFLLQCIKVKSISEVAQSCLTLCDPMDCSLPGSSIHGIFQARVLEWGAIAFTKKLLGTIQIQQYCHLERSPSGIRGCAALRSGCPVVEKLASSCARHQTRRYPVGPSPPKSPHHPPISPCSLYFHFLSFQPTSCLATRLLSFSAFVHHLQNIHSFLPFREYLYRLCLLLPNRSPEFRGGEQEKPLHGKLVDLAHMVRFQHRR